MAAQMTVADVQLLEGREWEGRQAQVIVILVTIDLEGAQGWTSMSQRQKQGRRLLKLDGRLVACYGEGELTA